MDDHGLTQAEREYLKALQERPKSVRSRIIAWALQLVLSIGLFGYGLYSDRSLFVVLGYLSLLYFSVRRMYAQFRGLE